MSEPAYTRAGAKAKRDWRRSIHTAEPETVYNYYADVEATFEHWVYSPNLDALDQETGIYKARFTLYLGAHESGEFNITGNTIADEKVQEYLKQHGAKVIGYSIKGLFRHFRGSPA